MGRVRYGNSAVAGLIGALLLAVDASACTDEKMKTAESGFVFKVVGGSDKVEAKGEPGSSETAFTLDLLAPYFVICDEDQFYKITDLAADTVAQAETGKVGYVRKDQVHPWLTRVALGFATVALTGDRPEIVAWDDEGILKNFLDTGNQKLAAPAFREDLESTLKHERVTRPYPVLGSSVRLLRDTVEKRVFDVLLPAALPAETKVIEGTEKVMTGAQFVIAFDATDSMASFAAQLAADLGVAFEALPAEIQKSSSVGFVFFRDEGDAEKYAIVPPTSVADATKALTEAATPTYMRGGSGPAVPVLDAVYIAHHLFPWNDNAQGGRRIILVVLGHDAKVVTRTKIHDDVPSGLDADQLAADLRDDGIQVATVQARPDSGKYLRPVLTTLAETTKGVFVEWGSGGDERRRGVTAAVARLLSERAETTFKKGAKSPAVDFDNRGSAAIPLKVLDGEKAQRLLDDAVKFNIDPTVGGVLIRRGFILDNSELLELKIQVDKKTLETLIELFSSVGASGADTEVMKDTAARVLAAIAGEGYDPNEALDVFIKKRLGIAFRPKFLDFKYIVGMNRSERQEMAKRIQNAGVILSQFLEDSSEALEKNQAVWMPLRLLP